LLYHGARYANKEDQAANVAALDQRQTFDTVR